MLARHPATAKHLSFQLAQYFVTDNPPASLTGKMAARYLATDGDIRQVLAADVRVTGVLGPPLLSLEIQIAL